MDKKIILRNKKSNFYPVILAGGRGTRFWPLSRKRRAKQLLALDGKQTMIQQTVARLSKLSSRERFWIITNEDLQREIARQLPSLGKRQIIAEPLGRNTAPAIGLAAFILLRSDPDAVIGMFPSDHVIGDEDKYRDVLQRGIAIAASGENIVVLGIHPTRAETGYGYIEAGEAFDGKGQRVRRFTEKPNEERAEEFLKAGNYFWNSGMFLWSARTLTNALREHLPKTAPLLEQIAAAFGTSKFLITFRKLYPKCENISIDYAVLEPRSLKGKDSNLYCLPAEFGWNDLGSWTALHEHHVGKRAPKDGNLISGQGIFTLNAQGNYVHAPTKFVAVVGVDNLVVVETKDALLITTRDQAQDVGKIVKHLDEKKLHKLV
ncbi:MAG: mannose-6-phosphate isomerase, type 2 [Acidobacteriaceae bacterium]|jgi:mannose-1-phosphate guanylyltransferase|nr:mannose-6-phosphate isomerase, type 2 [Acidobacteriaceae bacterium]